MAERSFYGVLFTALSRTDFVNNPVKRGREGLQGLRDAAVHRKLGAVDAFVSHSWHGAHLRLKLVAARCAIADNPSP
jgi:hypothetical protein